jgi:hypothetical protein
MGAVNLETMSLLKRQRFLKRVRKGVHIFLNQTDGNYYGTLERNDTTAFPLFQSETDAQSFGLGNNNTIKINLKADPKQVFWFAYQ